MTKRKLIVGAAAVAAIAGGTAGAIAATDDAKKTEQAVLSDAAKRLGVGTDELRDALSKAEDAQLGAAVKAGTLTQAQADEIKKHRTEDGTVLGFGHGPGPGGPGRGFGGPGGPHGGGPPLFDGLAKALGISDAKLMSQLRAGKTVEEIAKAQGKSLSDVEAAVKAAALERLDADVKAGRITKAQRDEFASHLDDLLEHLGDFGGRGPFGDHDRGHGRWGHP